MYGVPYFLCYRASLMARQMDPMNTISLILIGVSMEMQILAVKIKFGIFLDPIFETKLSIYNSLKSFILFSH